MVSAGMVWRWRWLTGDSEAEQVGCNYVDDLFGYLD